MASRKDKEKDGAADGKAGNRWWLTLGLLLVFLAGGGYYALSSMRAAAHKLAEGANNGALSDDSSSYGGGASVSRNENVFASEEPAAAPKPEGSSLNAKLKPGWVKEMLAEKTAAGQGAASSAVQGVEEEEQQKQPQAVQQAPQPGNTMGSRLQAKASFGGHFGGSPSKGAATSQVADFQSNGAVVGKPSVQRQTHDGAPKKAGRGGVMEALKGVFRASLYGARIASQDSAKSWVAKSFDATEEPTTAIEYDEQMRKKLDVVNPNSIPKFLREQDISAAEAKTLTAATVTKPEGDTEGTKEALKEDKDYQKKKAVKDVTDGMLNGLFSGISNNGSENGEDYQGANPMAMQSLFETDEFGNTIVPGENGLSYIFGTDGAILGCEDSAAGMCVMPGGDGCSADLTLSDF